MALRLRPFWTVDGGRPVGVKIATPDPPKQSSVSRVLMGPGFLISA
jgi:hypothetical protein